MAVKLTVQDVIDAFDKAMQPSAPQDGHNQLLQQLKAKQTGQLGTLPRSPLQTPVRR